MSGKGQTQWYVSDNGAPSELQNWHRRFAAVKMEPIGEEAAHTSLLHGRDDFSFVASEGSFASLKLNATLLPRSMKCALAVESLLEGGQ